MPKRRISHGIDGEIALYPQIAEFALLNNVWVEFHPSTTSFPQYFFLYGTASLLPLALSTEKKIEC